MFKQIFFFINTQVEVVEGIFNKRRERAKLGFKKFIHEFFLIIINYCMYIKASIKGLFSICSYNNNNNNAATTIATYW